MSDCSTCGTTLTDLNATEFRHVHDIGKCATVLTLQRNEARATLDARDKTIAELRAENECDACGGTGRPASGRPCMCGGTGKMSDAARYLRKELVIHEMVCGQSHSGSRIDAALGGKDGDKRLTIGVFGTSST